MRKCLLLLTLVLATPTLAADLDQFLRGVRRTVLPNGLTVITREQPGSGVVAVNTWVKAGYFHEPDEVAGMAHLFEHMFFKGSKAFPGANEIAEQINTAGGISNAGTIYDITNYYFVLPKENFVRALEIQADAIANPLFDPAELKKEAEVVIEESNRKYDNPPAVSAELMYATAFTQHRMKRWRIGSNEVLRNIKRENLLAFFETLYRPQNMILVLAGDITHDEGLRAAQKTFGKLAKGTLKKERGPAEPPQKEFRYGQASADIRQGYTNIGFHTPGAGNPDEIALDLLSTILGDGRSSRFFRGVIGPDGASTANAAHFTFEDIGIFQVQASFDEKNRAEVERRVIREIERIKTAGPTPFELQRAKNVIESDAVLALQDVLGQADALGEAETRGGYRNLAGNLQKLQSLTAEDVLRVARKYLLVENMTLHHYRPKGAPEMTRDAALAFVRAVEPPPPSVAESPAGDRKPAAEAAAAPLRPAPAPKPPQTAKLSNGATLVIEQRPGAPVVSIGVYFPGGRANENSANAGITNLLARSARRGTTTRTAAQIDEEIEFLGTSIGTDLQRDYFGFNVTVLARNLRPAAALLADVILNPTFPEQGVGEEKHLQKAAIKRSFDSATVRPQQLLEQTLYVNHPYALPQEGFVTSVDAIDPAALRAWWERHVVADDALIVVAGDVSAEDAKQLAESQFAALRKRGSAAARNTMGVPPVVRADTIEFRDRKQSAIVIGFPAVPMSHPDWLRLRVLQLIASGSSGTLFNELRNNRSLAYTVSAQLPSSAQSGAFVAFLASDAAKEEAARKGLLDELRRLQNDAVNDARLAKAKTYLAGITRIQQQTNVAHVIDLARNHYLGLGLDFSARTIEAAQKVTVDEVKAIAAKYLGGENYVVAVVRGKS